MGKPRRHRAFTPEFKAKIVELCRRGDRLGITVAYLRAAAGHGDAVLAHGTITSSLHACADLAPATDAVPETNGAILGTRCEAA
jgi:hypothetical protein